MSRRPGDDPEGVWTLPERRDDAPLPRRPTFVGSDGATPSGTTLLVLDRPDNTRTRVALKPCGSGGKGYVDLRIEFARDGAWHASKKGVTFKPRQIEALIAALQRARELAGDGT